MLNVHSIFGPTIQGEGTVTGVPSIFVRFSGCNMWSGEEKTRANSMCPFCDTDFLEGEQMEVDGIIETIQGLSGYKDGWYMVVLTGGEPLLQPHNDLKNLINILNALNYQTQIETNGSINSPLLKYIDIVTCSPKLPLEDCKINWGYVHNLKLLYPHPNPEIRPEQFNILDIVEKHLQPIDGPDYKENVKATIDKVYELGIAWKISLQTHKFMEVE